MRGPKQSAERVWVRRSRSSGAGIRAHGRVERSGVRTPHHLLNGAWLSVGDQCRRDPAVGDLNARTQHRPRLGQAKRSVDGEGGKTLRMG